MFGLASLRYLIFALAHIVFTYVPIDVFARFVRLFPRWVTLWALALSVSGVVLCYHFHISANMPISLLTIGVVFPVSFLYAKF